MGDADYLYAFQRIVMPIAYEFAPDFVIGQLAYKSSYSFRTDRILPIQSRLVLMLLEETRLDDAMLHQLGMLI
jgi:hypothetical protein